MCIGQKISFNQIRKITSVQLFSQKLKHIVGLDMHKRLMIVIEPAVIHLKSIHQSLWKSAEISLFILELIIIQRRFQASSLNPLFRNLTQGVLDDAHKVCLFFLICLLGHHGKHRLFDPIVIGTADVLADPGFHQSLFHRRALHREQCPVKNLKCDIQFFIKTCPYHCIIGEKRFVLYLILLADRIYCLHSLYFFKGFLGLPGCVHLLLFKIRQIMFVYECQVLFRIHIPV